MTALVESTGELVAADGLKLFYRHYRADSERARMVISHGLGEHAGRYGNVLERVVPKGISVWAPDHRGHGRSGGNRGHVIKFDQYVADLRATVALAGSDLPAAMPCFLLGHSLGGLIALAFALKHPDLVDGLVVSSPCLGMVIEVPPVKKALGSFMSRLWPGLTMGNELDAAHISRDPAVVSAYESDPLVHDRVSARFFTELMQAIEAVNQQALALKVPVLMQVADEDFLVNAESSKLFFDNLTVEDKTLHVYEGMYHEIYNAPPAEKKRVLDDLEEWLERKMTNG